MYALGNDPTFPTTFDYKNYYHYVELLAPGGNDHSGPGENRQS
jgi:hypothetical protein